MRKNCTTLKTLSFFLILVLLASRLATFSHDFFVEPIQDNISHAATLSADDECGGSYNFAKAKKLAFDLPVLELTENDYSLPSTLDSQIAHQPFIDPLEVFLDILVPPDDNLLLTI